MLETIIAIFIVVLAFSLGVVTNQMLNKEPPKIEVKIPEIKLPDIKIEIPEIVVSGNTSSASPDALSIAEAYEKQIQEEYEKNNSKAEQMTEDYKDLNEAASALMDNYLGGAKLNE